MQKRTVFCDECIPLITPVVSVVLPITKKYSMKVFAVSAYKPPLKSLILAKGRSDIVASRELGQLIWDRTYIKHAPIDYFVPIPLHWTRFAKRGFNQAEEMAKVLSQQSSKPVEPLLKRLRYIKLHTS